MKAIHHYWHDHNIVSISLIPLSALFCLLVFIRRQLYRLAWLKSENAGLAVIVVGNIYIGGNGKTPFVISLVEQLKRAGFRPAVVSRGYGAQSEQEAARPWPRRVNRQEDPRLFGDEPCLIHQATGCPVFIDPVRVRALKKIAQDTDCDVVVSDDGLQHYAMSRIIEINISDETHAYGNGLCLPAGPLRESLSRLASVDYIVHKRAAEVALQSMPVAYPDKTYVMNYLLQSLRCVSERSEPTMTLSDFKGKIVHAVAGIGNPGQFFSVLRQHGLQPIEHCFADHYRYTEQDLRFEQNYPIIMTEKDAIKCRSMTLPNAWYLPIKAQLDQRLFNNIIARLKIGT